MLKQEYKVNVELAKEGLEETLKMKINNLDNLIDSAEDGILIRTYNECLDAMRLARSMALEIEGHIENLNILHQELKRRKIRL